MSRKKELHTQTDKQDYTLVLLPTISQDLFLKRNIIYLSIKKNTLTYITLGMKMPKSFLVTVHEGFPCLNDLYHLSDPLCAHHAKSVLLPILADQGDIHQSLHEKFKMSLDIRYRFMQLLMTSYEYFEKHGPKHTGTDYEKKLAAIMAIMKNDVLMRTSREDDGEFTIEQEPFVLEDMRDQCSSICLFSPDKTKNAASTSTSTPTLATLINSPPPNYPPGVDMLKDQLKNSLKKELDVEIDESLKRRTIEQEMEYAHPAGIKRTADDVKGTTTAAAKEITSPNRSLSLNVMRTTAIKAKTVPFLCKAERERITANPPSSGAGELVL